MILGVLFLEQFLFSLLKQRTQLFKTLKNEKKKKKFNVHLKKFFIQELKDMKY